MNWTDEYNRMREQVRECLARDMTKHEAIKDLQLKDPQLDKILFVFIWDIMEDEELLLFKNYYKRKYHEAKRMRKNLEKASEVIKSYREQLEKGGPETKTQAVIEAEALLAARAEYNASYVPDDDIYCTFDTSLPDDDI